MNLNNVRNFVIIAHIDSGKSTLADRLLELTGTVEKRKMHEQFLDQMELERERGITIKLQPVRMIYRPMSSTNNESITNKRMADNLKFVNSKQNSLFTDEYILNLIDTPGHVDFTYEVSRSLAAVEGAVLLVDGTKGVQAQTLANLRLAQEQNLVIIPAINKIDLKNSRVEEIEEEMVNLLHVEREKILKISAKEGTNVRSVLERIISDIPPPKGDSEKPFKALIFDSKFDAYKGVIAFVRVFDGNLKRNEKIFFNATNAPGDVIEVGHFLPQLVPKDIIEAGEVGYIATGLKDPSLVKVGDTIFRHMDTLTYRHIDISTYHLEPLPGYKEPLPVVFASFYPEDAGQFDELRDALEKLRLTDSSLNFEPESSAALGRGFRLGFLGMLHVEIISERLKREFNLNLIVTSPSVEYHVNLLHGGSLIIRSASELDPKIQIESIEEPISRLTVIAPASYLGSVMKLISAKRSIYEKTDYLSANIVSLTYKIPLAEIITDFYDQLKGVSSGYASMSYEKAGYQKADLVRLDILVAGDVVEPFSRVAPKEQAHYIGKSMVEKLKNVIPRQWFEISLQAAIGSKIIARENIQALRKDVTGYLYGGDVTRKKKLLEKQKRGKKKMKEAGKVNIPQEVFLEMLKK